MALTQGQLHSVSYQCYLILSGLTYDLWHGRNKVRLECSHTVSRLHIHCSGGIRVKALTWIWWLRRAPTPGHLLFLSPLLLIPYNDTTQVIQPHGFYTHVFSWPRLLCEPSLVDTYLIHPTNFSKQASPLWEQLFYLGTAWLLSL